jgi:putative FmdB family regulatory protein
MPIYEYKCNTCGKKKEILQSNYNPLQSFEHLKKRCEGNYELQISIPAETDSTLGYPRTYENMGHNPITIDGRANKKKELRKRRLEESGPLMRFGCF